MINVYYEIPIIVFNDISDKEEEAYLECYDSTTRPSYVTKTVSQILESIAYSCSKNYQGLYIMIENNPLQHKEMKEFFIQVAQYLKQNYPKYDSDTNSFLALKSNVWFTRLVIEKQLQ